MEFEQAGRLLSKVNISKSNINYIFTYEPRHDKTNKVTVRPAMTRISLSICPVWSEPSLCAQWVAKDPSFFMRTAKTLIRLGGCPGWSESSLGAQSFCWFCHVAAHLSWMSPTVLVIPWRGVDINVEIILQTFLFIKHSRICHGHLLK